MKLVLDQSLTWPSLPTITAIIRPIDIVGGPYSPAPVVAKRALIDTGASISLLRRETFESVLRVSNKISEKIRSAIQIQGVSGSPILAVPFEVLLELQSRDGSASAVRQTIVYAATGLHYDFLLGNDLLTFTRLHYHGKGSPVHGESATVSVCLDEKNGWRLIPNLDAHLMA